VPWTNVC